MRGWSRGRGERAEIVNVARLVALITGADLLSQNLRQREASKIGGRERQQLEIALRTLHTALGCERRRLAQTNLQPDFAFTGLVPAMGIGRVHAPRQAILRLVVTVIRINELNSLLGVLERRAHSQNDIRV